MGSMENSHTRETAVYARPDDSLQERTLIVLDDCSRGLDDPLE